MAEAPAVRASRQDDAVPGRFAGYRALLAARSRAQLSYRTSFISDVLAAAMIISAEFGEVYVIFHNVRTLGGLTFRQCLLVWALARLSFAFANLAAGALDGMPEVVRRGGLEALMLRPKPVLAQFVAGELALRRTGYILVGATALVVAVRLNHIALDVQHLVLLTVTVVSGAVIFSSLFLTAGALQLWLVDAAPVTDALVYGTTYASTVPTQIYTTPVRAFLTFVIPAAFTAYLPALALLGLPGSGWLVGAWGWLGPLAAAAAATAALALWSLGLRHYTSSGG